MTNALTHVITYNYFDDTQRKVEMIYPNSDKITYKYDIRRTLESVTNERGKITTYEFDPQYRLKKITDPLSHVREFGYDAMSNRTSYKDPLGNITDYKYDDFNRLKEIEHPAATVGATRLKETFEHDKLGRMKKYFDTANRLTEYAYNDATRTNTVTNAELEPTQVKYDQRFQIFELKDALNQTYIFSYDPLGRMLSQTRAGGTMSFEYDEVGNIKKRTDYIGRVTNYTHDNLNRLTQIEYVPEGGGTSAFSNYAYDDISRLTSATNAVGTVSFVYDNRNRMTSTTDVFNHTIDYEYERTSTVNQKRLKFDSAMYAVYNFDNAERLSNIVNSSDSSTISFGYDNEDKPTSRTYPNGITTTYEYFDNDLLKKIVDSNASSDLASAEYTYNPARQISQIAEISRTRTFGYDDVDRLTSVTDSALGNESYTFDAVGNRLSSHLSTTYGYQSGQFNRLTSTDSATYQFDANGNTTQKDDGVDIWGYNWDHENRMTAATRNSDAAVYSYDALGRRVRRNVGGGTQDTKFIHDGADVLVDGDGGTLTKYINGEGVDNKLRVQQGTSVNYFLGDHLGSTTGLADASGSVVASTAYDSFGNATNASFPSRYQFTGREYDGFSGLHYYRARWYEGSVGRFMSEDPIGFGGGDVNLYGYVHNNSANRNDPFGLIDPIVNQDPRIYRVTEEDYDEVQRYLEMAGMAPFIGEPCDLAAGVMSALKGDFAGVGLSAIAMIPGLIGNAAGVTKLGRNAKKGGRRGSAATRDQLDVERDAFLNANPEFDHVGGGRNRLSGDDMPEEYIPNPDGGRKGSSYPDLTFEGPDGTRVRVNTADTNKDGTFTSRELRNADKMKRNTRNGKVIMIRKRR